MIPLASGGSSSSQGSRQIDIVWKENADEVMQGFNPCSFETAIYSEVLNKLDPFHWPESGQKENDVVHHCLSKLMDLISDAAQAKGITTLKGFHEYDTVRSDDKRRPDWIFTLPNEQRHGVFNRLFYLEAKRPDTTKDALFREGIDQCLNHIANQHIKSGCLTSHGIGVVTDSDDILFLRVQLLRFEVTETREQCPIAITGALPLRPQTGAEATGLRYLVRLLCESNVESFGLPPANGVPVEVLEQYVPGALLGDGGFSTVTIVNAKEGKKTFACKFVRDKSNHEFLSREERILSALGKIGCKNCPRLHGSVHNEAGTLVAILLEPVGYPLTSYALKDQKSAARQLFKEISSALKVAHCSSIYHGDIRPSNIIVTEKPDGSIQFTLIDWGLGEDSETLQRKKHRSLNDVFGQARFMSAEKLKLLRNSTKLKNWTPSADHDIHALVLTAVDIAFREDAAPLWEPSRYPLFNERNLSILSTRKKWFQENMDAINEAFQSVQDFAKLVQQVHEADVEAHEAIKSEIGAKQDKKNSGARRDK